MHRFSGSSPKALHNLLLKRTIQGIKNQMRDARFFYGPEGTSRELKWMDFMFLHEVWTSACPLSFANGVVYRCFQGSFFGGGGATLTMVGGNTAQHVAHEFLYRPLP